MAYPLQNGDNHTSTDDEVTPIDWYDLEQFDFIMGILLPSIICIIGIIGEYRGYKNVEQFQ